VDEDVEVLTKLRYPLTSLEQHGQQRDRASKVDICKRIQ